MTLNLVQVQQMNEQFKRDISAAIKSKDTNRVLSLLQNVDAADINMITVIYNSYTETSLLGLTILNGSIK